MITSIRARVQRKNDRWHLTVFHRDVVIFTDHGSDLSTMHEIATRVVGVFREAEAQGQTFRPWAERVAEARAAL